MSSGMLVLASLFVSGPPVAQPDEPAAPPVLRFTTPVPVQPWETKQEGRIPIHPPIREGRPLPICEDPPTDKEVLAALPKTGGVPNVCEVTRDDIVIVKNRLLDKVDPPRFFPLVGTARFHHCHWECIVHYTEVLTCNYPFPARMHKQKVSVVYIDKDFLHSVATEAPKPVVQAISSLGVMPPACPAPQPAVAAGNGLRIVVPQLGPAPIQTQGPPAEVHQMMIQAFGQMGAPVAQPAPMPPMPVPGFVRPASAAWTAPSPELPEGTWIRTVGPVRYKLEVKAKTMVVTVTMSEKEDDGNVVTIDHVMTIDWYPTRKENEIIGTVASFDFQPNGKVMSLDDVPETLAFIVELQKAFANKPVALSWKVVDGTLVVGDVRMPELKDDFKQAWSLFEALGGNYKSDISKGGPVITVDFLRTETPGLQYGPRFYPDPPVIQQGLRCFPALPICPQTRELKLIPYSGDTNARMQQLLEQSEDLRQIGQEWHRFWFQTDPKLTPERIHGGLIQATPSRAIDDMTLPSPRYLQHKPLYFPAEPTFPLPRELQTQEAPCPTVCPPLEAHVGEGGLIRIGIDFNKPKLPPMPPPEPLPNPFRNGGR